MVNFKRMLLMTGIVLFSHASLGATLTCQDTVGGREAPRLIDAQEAGWISSAKVTIYETMSRDDGGIEFAPEEFVPNLNQPGQKCATHTSEGFYTIKKVYCIDEAILSGGAGSLVYTYSRDGEGEYVTYNCQP